MGSEQASQPVLGPVGCAMYSQNTVDVWRAASSEGRLLGTRKELSPGVLKQRLRDTHSLGRAAPKWRKEERDDQSQPGRAK